MTMKKYLKKRIIPAGLSLILIIMTVISIMPINVSAEDSLNVIEISRVNELIEEYRLENNPVAQFIESEGDKFIAKTRL